MMPTEDSPKSPRRRILFVSATLLAILLPTVMHLRETHAAVIRPEDIEHATAPPRLDASHPCLLASIKGSNATTRLDRCATPTGASPAVDDEERFEVDLRYGVFVLRQTDLHLTDDFDVPLTRSYVSQDWITANGDHAFGHNTSHPFDIAPLGTRNPYTYLTLVLEDGDFLYFNRISPGTSFTDAVYLHTDTSTPFYKATISWNGDGWTLKRVDGLTMRFPEAYNAKSTAQGAARERTNASGAKLLLNRDSDGNLQEILTPHQRRMHFEHDQAGHITRAEDDRSHWANYTYNNLGMLTQVVNSSGAERHYEYNGVQMTAITDGQGLPSCATPTSQASSLHSTTLTATSTASTTSGTAPEPSPSARSSPFPITLNAPSSSPTPFLTSSATSSASNPSQKAKGRDLSPDPFTVSFDYLVQFSIRLSAL